MQGPLRYVGMTPDVMIPHQKRGKCFSPPPDIRHPTELITKPIRLPFFLGYFCLTSSNSHIVSESPVQGFAQRRKKRGKKKRKEKREREKEKKRESGVVWLRWTLHYRQLYDFKSLFQRLCRVRYKTTGWSADIDRIWAILKCLRCHPDQSLPSRTAFTP